MEKQTAVEWLIEQLNKNTWYDESNCPQVNIGVINLEQAKEMDIKQTKDAYLRGIENYDPTFKNMKE